MITFIARELLLEVMHNIIYQYIYVYYRNSVINLRVYTSKCNLECYYDN